MSYRVGSLITAFLAIGCAAAFAQQQVSINFAAQCPNGQTSFGPCSSTFAAAGPPQSVTIQTAAGPVTFSGGVLTNSETYNLVDGNTVYSTASFGAGGYQQAITIKLPVAATNFFVQLINGDPYVEAYTVSDNASHSSSLRCLPTPPAASRESASRPSGPRLPSPPATRTGISRLPASASRFCPPTR